MTRILVVGLGSPHGDDQVGWLVADRLAADAGPDLMVRRAGSPWDLAGWLESAERLVVCDASEPAGYPGRIRRWTWPIAQFPQRKSGGSHDFDLTNLLQLAETLEQLPSDVVLFGVEAEACQPHAELSAPVAAVIPQVVAAIRKEVEPQIPQNRGKSPAKRPRPHQA